jgi:ABC-type transport system substrate-binding protein
LAIRSATLRRAVALTIDRKAFVDTLTEGKGDSEVRCPSSAASSRRPERLQRLNYFTACQVRN